jgi:hypothetical protein
MLFHDTIQYTEECILWSQFHNDDNMKNQMQKWLKKLAIISQARITDASLWLENKLNKDDDTNLNVYATSTRAI